MIVVNEKLLIIFGRNKYKLEMTQIFRLINYSRPINLCNYASIQYLFMPDNRNEILGK